MEDYVGTTRDPFLHSLLPRDKGPQLAISLLQALGHRVREWKPMESRWNISKLGLIGGLSIGFGCLWFMTYLLFVH